MPISRRSFLKLFGAVPAIAFAPKVLEISANTNSQATNIPMTASEVVGNEQGAIGVAREMIQYDIGQDSYVVRHEIFDGKTQICVNQPVKLRELYEENAGEVLKFARGVASEVLSRRMLEIGISANSLKKLPMVCGIKHCCLVKLDLA